MSTAASVQTTCRYCTSVLVRTDVDLKAVGVKSSVPPSVSPIRLGTRGSDAGRRFEVVGRLVYAWERGRWNEWHLAYDDGGTGWLSDAQAEYALTAQLPAGGFASGAEFVKNVSTGPSSGGHVVGKHFYLTTGRELRIYDTSTPEDPVEVGRLTLTSPGAADQRAPEEDPDTNGRVLLTTNGGNLQVYDVSDPTAPKLASELEGLDQHTVSSRRP